MKKTNNTTGKLPYLENIAKAGDIVNTGSTDVKIVSIGTSQAVIEYNVNYNQDGVTGTKTMRSQMLKEELVKFILKAKETDLSSKPTSEMTLKELKQLAAVEFINIKGLKTKKDILQKIDEVFAAVAAAEDQAADEAEEEVKEAIEAEKAEAVEVAAVALSAAEEVGKE